MTVFKSIMTNAIMARDNPTDTQFTLRFQQVQVLFAWDPKDVLDTPAFKSIHEQL